MAPKTPVLSYREALLAEAKPFPLPSVPSLEKESKAVFVLTAQEDKIRENIRYRIYDFCFDIVYDEAPKPSIMQYIRVLDLPPHRFFNRGHWEATMVHGHWSHEPRGLALLRVCKSIYHEVFFRFYWFHVPNLILSDGDMQGLRYRLRKIPEPHHRNVNAQLKFRYKPADKRRTESSDAILVSWIAMAGIISLMGLAPPDAPWVEHTNVDGKRERIILGVGFHILEELGPRTEVECLSFVGKLGNMVFRRDYGGLDFEASASNPSRERFTASSGEAREVNRLYDVLCHIRHHLEKAAGAMKQTSAYLQTLHIQSSEISRNVGFLKAHETPELAETTRKQHAPESNHQTNTTLASEDTPRVSGPTGHQTPTGSHEHEQGLSPCPQHNFRRSFGKYDPKGQLRGGDFLGLLHELNLYTVDLIGSLEHTDALCTSSPGKDEELLVQEETKHSTQVVEPLPLEEVLQALPDESELGVLHISRPESENDVDEERGNPTTYKTSKEEDSLESSQKISKNPIETHGQLSSQTMHPLRLEERSLSDCNSIGVGSNGQYSRAPSFETRIAQWITRENDCMPSRKSSITWSDGREACELFSRKRVTSSNYRTRLPHRPLSNKHSSSSAAVHQTAAPSLQSTSFPCSTLAVTDISAPPTPTDDVANASAESAAPAAAASPPQSSPNHQAENSNPLVRTPSASIAKQASTSITDHAAASPPSRDLPLSDTTNAQMTPAVHDSTPAAITTTAATTTTTTAPSSSQSSRRVSASSNAASMCVGDSRRAEDEPIVVIPGAKQFLTPKRDVKPWWEASGGGSQSTGGKQRKRKGRERETRGSTNSWISLE